jgi:RNA polymerase-associated protein RTF1
MSSDSEDNYVGEESSGEEEEPSLDENLTYGKSDELWLNSLSDIQREEVFFERFKKRQDSMEKKKILKLSGKDKKSSLQKAKRKEGALQEIKAARHQDILAKRKQSNKKASKYRSSSESASAEEEPEEHDDYDKFSSKRSHDQMEEKPVIEITLEDIQKCVVTRNKLAKWYGEPFFMANVKDLFVRIGTNQGIGGNKSYKLAEIAAIMDSTRTFKLGKKDCKHMAQLKFGDGSLKRYELEYISNQEVTQFEFDDWMRACLQNPDDIPTKAHIEALVEQISRSDHYDYTAADFREQIKKNKESNPNFVKLTHEILKLKVQIEEEEDEVKKETYKRQLKEAELKDIEKRKLIRGNVGISLESINKRNENINKELTRARRYDEDEDDDGSAFRQTATKSTNAWVSNKKLGGGTNVQPKPQSQDASDMDGEPAQKKAKLEANNSQDMAISISVIPLNINIDILSDTKPDPSALYGIIRSNSNLGSQSQPSFRSGSIPVGAKSFSLAEYKASKANQL